MIARLTWVHLAGVLACLLSACATGPIPTHFRIRGKNLLNAEDPMFSTSVHVDLYQLTEMVELTAKDFEALRTGDATALAGKRTGQQ
jgi:type VI secretion system VasD/TssJ family lipoprotein